MSTFGFKRLKSIFFHEMYELEKIIENKRLKFLNKFVRLHFNLHIYYRYIFGAIKFINENRLAMYLILVEKSTASTNRPRGVHK